MDTTPWEGLIADAAVRLCVALCLDSATYHLVVFDRSRNISLVSTFIEWG